MSTIARFGGLVIGGGLLLAWSLTGVSAAEIDAAKLYQDYCSVCHGDRGDGKSRTSGSMLPPPRDFTAPQAITELPRERMIQSVREGRPGTAMAGWKSQLNDEQIAAIVDFVRDRFMIPTAYDTTNEGKRIYAEFCSVCHGDRGNGISRASGSLYPRPADFTSAQASHELTRERMIFSVTYGRPNTAMAGWGTQLNEDQIGDVVDYVRATFMRLDAAKGGGGEEGADQAQGEGSETEEAHGGGGHAVPTGDLATYFKQPFPSGLNGNSQQGEALFRDNCVPCHGDQGDGRGPRAYFILPKPRDFRLPASRASLNRPHLFEAIAEGTRGTEMPAWEKVLSDQQIADISEYMLQTFIRPDEGGPEKKQ